MPTTRNLAVLIFDDVEVLDFCGPFEVFSVANGFTDPPAFHVFTVAEKAGPVLAPWRPERQPASLLRRLSPARPAPGPRRSGHP